MTAVAYVEGAVNPAGDPDPVTVVVPTHRRPELMRRAVQSVVDQTYLGALEILVVFDACDLVLPDVDLPAGRTLRGLVNTRTRGLAGARNSGILEASTDFVAFLDDDDYWLPTKLVEQMAVFDADPGVVMVGTGMRIDDGHSVRTRLVPTETVTHADLLQNRLAGPHASSFVFRKKALTSTIGMVDESLPGSYGEDYDLLLETSKVAPIKLVNEPLVHVAWQGQSLFVGKWKQYAEGLQYIVAKHPEFAADRRAFARIDSQLAFAYAAAGELRRSRPYALRSLRKVPSGIKAYLALAVSLRLISADRIIAILNRVGRGI